MLGHLKRNGQRSVGPNVTKTTHGENPVCMHHNILAANESSHLRKNISTQNQQR